MGLVSSGLKQEFIYLSALLVLRYFCFWLQRSCKGDINQNWLQISSV